jgi:hypothetical protein
LQASQHKSDVATGPAAPCDCSYVHSFWTIASGGKQEDLWNFSFGGERGLSRAHRSWTPNRRDADPLEAALAKTRAASEFRGFVPFFVNGIKAGRDPILAPDGLHPILKLPLQNQKDSDFAGVTSESLWMRKSSGALWSPDPASRPSTSRRHLFPSSFAPPIDKSP